MTVVAFFLSGIFHDTVMYFYPSIQDYSCLCSADDTCNDSSVNKEARGVGLPADEQPDIFCEEPIYHFGRRYKYEDIKHTFVLLNRGKKELKIGKIENSCGCVTGEKNFTTVASNMSGTIDVNFRSGPETGTITKTIRVYSNDPDTPVYMLQLSGEIIEDITIYPRQIRFRDVPLGEKAYAEIVVQPRPGFALEIKDVISSSPVIIAKCKKDEQKNKYIIEATLKDTTMVGMWSGNLSLFTNSERQRQIIVPFTGEVLGDVRLYPQRLYFGVVKRNSECGKSVFVTLLKNNIRINRIETHPKYLVSENIKESQIGEIEKNTTIRVHTKIKKDAPAGKINGILKIYTNSKIQPVIDVPVSGEIVEG